MLLLDDVSREELQDLYRLPYFFKAVAADVGEKTLEASVAAVVERLGQQRRAPDESERPSWLLWSASLPSEDAQAPVERLAERSRSRVLARFTSGLPFLIDRKLGRGQVLLVCTGVSPQWNTLPLTNTMLVFDRILRGMFEGTLPQRKMDTQEQFVLPVAAADRHAQIALVDPSGREEPLTVDVLGTDRYGVTVSDRTQRGIYHVVATSGKDPSQDAAGPKLWDTLLAVNGPAQESELGVEEKPAGGQAGAASTLRDAAQAASPSSQPLQPGQELWKWGLLAVLALLLAELALLAWPSLREGRPS